MDKSVAVSNGARRPAQPTPSVPNQIDGPLLVNRLMALAFFPGRAPRSVEYREGCQAALEYRILSRRMPPRYRVGSCEADAWFAGAEEGHAIWRRKCETAAVPDSLMVRS